MAQSSRVITALAGHFLPSTMGVTHSKDLMPSSGVLGLQDARVHINS